MNLLEILIGQIPEAIYFALFLILTKKLKEKRLIFTLLSVFEYVLLFNIFKSNIMVHIIYTIFMYCLLKVFYGKKCQVTDVFTIGIASIILMIVCIVLYGIMSVILPVYFVYAILTRVAIFAILFIFRNKLNRIQKMYKKLWNRDDKVKKKVKSTTFRSVNLVIFNLMFYVINLCMICVWLYRR